MTSKTPKRKARPGVDGYGRSPLHYAAADGELKKCKELLTAGADPNTQDDNGRTPLHFAAQANAAEVAAALIEAGAVLDSTDAYGNTPLSTAVFNSLGKGDLIAALRMAGADPHAKNNHGVSPLSLARTITNFDVAQHFDDLP
ncbi:ankyrin repeat domain-containing protein [Ideonella sp.]|jgi:ankyrin repeat protein|uniref:ankyrin repeat domain-containing protein n=1 Tax=Ideonella sp. TaxID=1929293 RepID=UPI0037BF92DD